MFIKEAESGNEQPDDRGRDRAAAARINFLAVDRSDLRYAAWNVSQHMAVPVTIHNRFIENVGKYLKGKETLEQHFRIESKVERIEVFTDSELAGCTTTRRPTSGGVVL